MVRFGQALGIRIASGALVLGLLTGSAFLMAPTPAEAHCDSVEGPVVKAARAALESGDIRLVTPYVKPAAEAELGVAFRQALAVRGLGGEARELADRSFFETTVRLHRIGEGASYTGLKTIVEVSPALHAAELALEQGQPKPALQVLENAVREGFEQRYHAVLDAREHEAAAGTVEAARERAEAELRFEQYVEGLYQAALGAGEHAESTDHADQH